MKIILILVFYMNTALASDRHLMYVPHSGGIADFAARVLANVEGNTVVVNYPAIIGSRAVPLAYEKKQLLFSGSSYLVINQIVYPDYKHFDIASNFDTVILGKLPNVVSLNSSIDVKTISEFKRYKFNDLRYGITTAASHVSALEFLNLTGISARSVPYKSGDQLNMGLLSNEIQLKVGNLSSMIGLMGTNKIRVIGITTEKRHKDYPDIPTIREQTGNNLISVLYYGVSFPHGMNPSSKKYWQKLIMNIHKNEKYIQETEKLGAQFELIADKNYKKWYKDQIELYRKYEL